MNRTDMTGSLMFFTIGAVLVIAVIALLWFLRKPKNRHPISDDHPIGTPSTGGTDDPVRHPDQ